MITAPANWETIFSGPHKTEFMLEIDGEEYSAEYIQEPPVLTRPLMDAPMIGKVCSATLTVTVRNREDEGLTIATAAEVDLFCRLATNDDASTTDWIELGRFLVSSRRAGTGVTTLTCRDYMLKTGRTYFDKASFSEWPQTYADVVADIADIIGVEEDPRNDYPSGDEFMVDVWGDDTLMSEVLSGIAAGCAGNFVMTGEGKLRLVPFSKDTTSLTPGGGDDDPPIIIGPIGPTPYVNPALALAEPDTYIDKAHHGLTLLEAGTQTITHVILIAQEDEEYEAAAATDNGLTIEASCPFANQDVADYVLGKLSLTRGYLPYNVQSAYLDPLAEPGDLAEVTDRDDNSYRITLNSLTTICNTGFQTDLASDFDAETADEYPYETPREVQARRAIKTSAKYYGNSITHAHGFRSELESGAYAEFNADSLKFVDESGTPFLYYDAVSRQFRIDTLDVIVSKMDNIGGRNLLVGSAKKHWTAQSGAALTFTDDQTVSEWGADDAIRMQGTRGSADLVAKLATGNADYTVALNNVPYVFSMFVKNAGSAPVTIGCNGLGDAVEIEAGASDRIVLYAMGDGLQALDFTLTVASSASPFDLYYWHPQVEQGEVATAWTPAPEDMVGNDEIITKINLTPGSAQIQADKISLAGKTIDLTSDTIEITSTNFSVTPAGVLTATGVNVSGSFNMTGGSINIETSSASADNIKLRYGSNSAWMTPISFSVTDGTNTSSLGQGTVSLQYGTESTTLNFNSLSFFKNGTGAGYYNSTGWSIHNASTFNTYSAGYESLYVQYVSSKERVRLRYDEGLVFKNSSGTQTAAYPVSLTASRALVTSTNGLVAVSSVTSTELGYLSGVTSAIQTQLNGKQATITGGASTIVSSNFTASRALVSNSSGKAASSSVTATELGYLSGVTSAIQTQLGNKAAKPTQVTNSVVKSTTTSNTYSGIGCAIPAGKFFTITAQAYYSAKAPTVIILATSSSSVSGSTLVIEGKVDSSNTRAVVTYSGYTSAAKTFYLWGKAASAGNVGYAYDAWYV